MLDGDIGMNAATAYSLPDYTPVLYEGRLCHTLPRKGANISCNNHIGLFGENEYVGKEARNYITAVVSRNILDLKKPDLPMAMAGYSSETNSKKVFKDPFYKSTKRIFRQAAEPILHDPITQTITCYNVGPDTIEELE